MNKMDMTKNLKTAISAFWSILRDEPHVYCDHSKHSVTGTRDTVENQINILISAVNAEAGQQDFLTEVEEILR